jgi:hypothetical protein
MPFTDQIDPLITAVAADPAEEIRQAISHYEPSDLIAVLAKRLVALESGGGGGGGGGGGSFARVQRSSAIAGWDGSTLPFNIVTADADGLWDADNHQYVAQVAGWYELSAYATGISPGGVTDDAAATNTVFTVTAVVFGAGDNVSTGIGEHTAVTTGVWVFPPLHGHTHLDPGDAVVIQGTSGINVPSGFTFAIQLTKAD